MTLEIVPSQPDHVETLGEICYRAFEDISSRHGFEKDFESPQMAEMILGGLVRNEDCYSISMLDGGELAGSNFITTADEVGTIGPISVDPNRQGKGIGRALMEDALRYARDNGIERVRLLQDSFNMQSLALYGSLGFDTKAPCALLQVAPADVPGVRRATADDLGDIERLSSEIYTVSRRREVEHNLGSPFHPFVHEQGGRIVAYFTPGIVGHGVGETEEALTAAVLGAAAQVPPTFQQAFCPLIEGALYRRLIAAGCRNVKVMNLMALGPYEAPRGPWMPSVGF